MTVTRMSSAKTIALVARREFVTRVVTKSFLVSTAVILILLIGGQIVFAAVGGRDDPAKVGLIGGDAVLSSSIESFGKDLDTKVDVRTVNGEAKARSQVKNGDLDVILIADGNRVITDSDLEPGLKAVLESATQSIAIEAALTEQDVDPNLLSEAGKSAALKVEAIDPDDPDQDQRLALAYVAVILLFMTVYLYGLYVAMGVVEEKSSRVVELLLSTIKPIHLLTGKVIGIGAVGLLQVLAFGGTALVTGIVTDLVTVRGTAVTLFGAVVVWYILGYAFFAMLYAGLGALVSRQEDVNSVTMPLTILSFATFFAAQSALSDPDSTWASILSWIPPFSATLMPLRIAADVTNPLQIVVTILLMVLLTAAAAVLAARLYERSVLNTGSKESWKSIVARVK